MHIIWSSGLFIFFLFFLLIYHLDYRSGWAKVMIFFQTSFRIRMNSLYFILRATKPKFLHNKPTGIFDKEKKKSYIKGLFLSLLGCVLKKVKYLSLKERKESRDKRPADQTWLRSFLLLQKRKIKEKMKEIWGRQWDLSLSLSLYIYIYVCVWVFILNGTI